MKLYYDQSKKSITKGLALEIESNIEYYYNYGVDQHGNVLLQQKADYYNKTKSTRIVFYQILVLETNDKKIKDNNIKIEKILLKYKAEIYELLITIHENLIETDDYEFLTEAEILPNFKMDNTLSQLFSNFTQGLFIELPD